MGITLLQSEIGNLEKSRTFFSKEIGEEGFLPGNKAKIINVIFFLGIYRNELHVPT